MPTREPAIISYLLAAVAAIVAAFVAHASPMQLSYIATIATGVASLITAYAANPTHVPVISGGAATLLTATASFGMHLPPNTTAVLTSLVTTFIAIILRMHLTPAPVSISRRPPAA